MLGGSHCQLDQATMKIFTDCPSLVSPNTKIIFLQADEQEFTIRMPEPLKHLQRGASWFDINSLFEDGQISDNAFNRQEALHSANRIKEVINEEVKTNLDGNYQRLWIGGISQGGWQAFFTATELEQNVGGVLLIQTAIEPLVKIAEIPESKKPIKIIYFAS